MKIKQLMLCAVAFWAALAVADEPTLTAKQANYNEFARLIHKVVVSQVPKVYEGKNGWGQTIPIPEGMRLGRLRKLVQVGDHQELPHGHWRKVRVWLDDPNRDLKIRVRDLRNVDKTMYHLALAVDAALRTETEVQQWQKGLSLLHFTARADARVGVLLDCDVALSLEVAKFPPDLKIEPKVTDLKMTLQEFNLRQVEVPRLGTAVHGEMVREVGNKFKGVLQELMRAAEPSVKEHANQAIARSLREGHGTLSAGALLKALTPKTKE
jgi:hypothetical protein